MKFYPETHKYIHKNQEYLSCTTLVGQLFPKFKKSEIATRCAKKQNVRKKNILREWKRSSTIGTIVHEYAEDVLNKKKPKSDKFLKTKYKLDQEESDKIFKFKQNVNNIIPNLPKGEIITEQILFDEKTLISGTIDLPIYTSKIIHVMDWKTSKQISRFAFNKETDLMDFGVPNANYYKYSMQLAVYQYLIMNTSENKESENYKGQKFQHYIIHIPSEEIICIPKKEMNKNNKNINQILNKRKLKLIKQQKGK